MVIGAGRSHLRTMTDRQLFEVNAGIVQRQAILCATVCPHAIIAVTASPKNYLVPLVSEVFKQHGVYNPDKIIGMSTLCIVPANTIVGRAYYLDPDCIHVPVICGNSDNTMVPLLSKAQPFADFSKVNFYIFFQLKTKW